MTTNSGSPLDFDPAEEQAIWCRVLQSLDAAERLVLSGPVARDFDRVALRARAAELDFTNYRTTDDEIATLVRTLHGSGRRP